MSASSQPDIARAMGLLGHVGAVHGLYYLLMHGWFMYFRHRIMVAASSCLAIGRRRRRGGLPGQFRGFTVCAQNRVHDCPG